MGRRPLTSGIPPSGHLPGYPAASASAEIHSRVYTSEGDTLDYVYELDSDTLTIWGGQRGSDAHYTGTFSADGGSLTGALAWPGGGYQTTSICQTDAIS